MPLYQLAVIYQVGVCKRLLHCHVVISSYRICQSLCKTSPPFTELTCLTVSDIGIAAELKKSFYAVRFLFRIKMHARACLEINLTEAMVWSASPTLRFAIWDCQNNNWLFCMCQFSLFYLMLRLFLCEWEHTRFWWACFLLWHAFSFMRVSAESVGLRNKLLRKVEELKNESECSGIPDEFLCPITRELMRDPVIAAGKERSAFFKNVFYKCWSLNVSLVFSSELFFHPVDVF